MTVQQLTILGATGSIGTSTLDIIRLNRQQYSLFALTAQRSVEKMRLLCEEFNPTFAVLVDEDAANALRRSLSSSCDTVVRTGTQALVEVSQDERVDTVMAAIVGAAGLLPTLAAVTANKRVLLANKEALVMSGELFIKALRQSSAVLMPVDSEHNAIFQALPQQAQQQLGYCPLTELGVSKLLLTGSGGPFLTRDLSTLSQVTPEQACAHPNWTMGRKISVDSATMMNKGLEYIEARWLFDTKPNQIEVVIHPQSVIHSMVQYIDGSVIAQLGQPDMKTPIAYAMAYPQRINSGVKPLDFSQLKDFTFSSPDYQRFPCLKLAIDACYAGQGATTSLNAANEIAVEAFLNQQIKFTDIAAINQRVLDTTAQLDANCLEGIIAVDRQARVLAQQIIAKRAGQ